MQVLLIPVVPEGSLHYVYRVLHTKESVKMFIYHLNLNLTADLQKQSVGANILKNDTIIAIYLFKIYSIHLRRARGGESSK